MNKYAGDCYRCGKNVSPGEGFFERISRSQRSKFPKMPLGMKWLTQHKECSTEYKGTSYSAIFYQTSEKDKLSNQENQPEGEQ